MIKQLFYFIQIILLKRCTVCALVIFICIPSIATSQQFEWGKSFPSQNAFIFEGCVAYPQGGLFVHGYFSNSLTIGTEQFDIGNSTNGIVIRYDSAGTVLWVKTLPFSYSGSIRSASVDEAGSIYITGYFSGTITFASQTIEKLPADGETTSYLAKLDSTGDAQWIRKLPNTIEPTPKVDIDGNILLTGSDYPYAGVGTQAWLYKYSPQGNLIYKKVLTSSTAYSSYAIPSFIDENEMGEIFISGYFTGEVTVGDSFLSALPPSAVNYDLFIMKLSVTGKFIWTKNIGSANNGQETNGNIMIDQQCNLYVSGWIGDRTMLSKYDGNGDLIWKKDFGASDRVFGRDVTVDAGGNVYFIATYYNNVTIDNNTILGSTSGNMMMCKMNYKGEIQWIVNSTPGENNVAYKFTKGNKDEIYIVGTAGGTLEISNLTMNLSDPSDPFILKYIMPKVNPLSPADVPILDLGKDIELCIGESFKIELKGFSKYIWDDGSIDSVRILSIAGEYALTAYDGCGNHQKDTVVVSNKPIPYLNLGSDRFLCEGEIFVVSFDGYASYRWHDGSNGASFTINKPGTYSLTAIDSCGFVHQDTLNVLVAPTPDLDLGNDLMICLGENLTIKAPGFSFYEWQDGSTNSTFTIAAPGVYTLTAIDLCGVIYQDTLLVSVVPPKYLNLGDDRLICEGERLVISVPGFLEYRWQDGSTTQSITILSPGTYSLAAVDECGFVYQDTLTLTACPHPELELGDDFALCKGESHLLELSGFTEYVWQDGSTKASFNIKEVGIYYVRTRDEFGLLKYDTLQVTNCLFIPNIITPNGDDINDAFIIQGVDENYNHELIIYNRWGKTIFQSNDYHNTWKAEDIPTGIYYYAFIDGKTKAHYSGWIQVLN